MEEDTIIDLIKIIMDGRHTLPGLAPNFVQLGGIIIDLLFTKRGNNIVMTLLDNYNDAKVPLCAMAFELRADSGYVGDKNDLFAIYRLGMTLLEDKFHYSKLLDKVLVVNNDSSCPYFIASLPGASNPNSSDGQDPWDNCIFEETTPSRVYKTCCRCHEITACLTECLHPLCRECFHTENHKVCPLCSLPLSHLPITSNTRQQTANYSHQLLVD